MISLSMSLEYTFRLESALKLSIVWVFCLSNVRIKWILSKRVRLSQTSRRSVEYYYKNRGSLTTRNCPVQTTALGSLWRFDVEGNKPTEGALNDHFIEYLCAMRCWTFWSTTVSISYEVILIAKVRDRSQSLVADLHEPMWCFH